MENKDWKITYVDMYGDEISHIILHDMTKDEAELRGAVNTPIDRAIEDYTVEPINE